MRPFQPILSRHQRRRWRQALAALLLTLLAGWAGAQALDEPVVALIDVQGNQFLQRDTLLYYVATKAGDRYDERRLRDDFRRLWDTGFLEDMILDVRDTPRGKAVIFQVRERKRIQVIDYRGSKVLTTSNIEEELKKKEAALKIDTFYDLGKARRVEGVIKQMLIEKGRTFGTVKHDAKAIGTSGTQVSFVIDDGPKVKVKSIEFTGNQVFSDGALRKRMKKIKVGGFSGLLGKNKYTEEKWSDGPESDKARLLEKYLDNGYVTASVGDPQMTYTDGGSKKKPVKWMHLTIPVVEGDQYRVGEVTMEGLTVFKPEALLPIFKLQGDDVYRESRIKKGFEKLRDLYGSQGYFQFTGYPQRKPDPVRKVVDVALTLEEDKRYYVGRIRFTGNQSTRDKVIRREIYMNEGEVFNTEALKLSVKRINQLGYFKPMEGAPEFALTEGKDDHLDITFKVEEQNRNQFTFGGGVSGLEGTFLNASFSTANFLGLGETLQLALQTGKRTKNYQLAVTEPYLFDRPITAGFDVFKRKLIVESYGYYQGYVDDRIGLSLTAGLPVSRFSRLFANYAYEVVNIDELPPEYQVTPVDPGTTPVQYIDYGERRESRIGPSYVYNTVDNPWSPRSGSKLTVGAVVAGGPLGGTLDYFRPTLEVIKYVPHLRRTALGLRFETAWIQQYGDTESLPYYLRFRLGGETQVRGYNNQTIGPVDYSVNPPLSLGGNKYLLFNAEYYVDVVGPLRALLFFDAGQAYLDSESIALKDLRISTGVEMRFLMPVLNVPFRLIYAFNPNRDPRDRYTPSSTFKFAVGTTF